MSEDTDYDIKIRAENSDVSTTSGEIEITETTGTDVPVAPTLSSTNTTHNSTILSITDGVGGGTPGEYILERKISGGTFSELTKIVYTSSPMNYEDLGLLPNTEYIYRLKAENGEGQSGYSSLVSIETGDPIPSRPTYLSVSNIDYNTITFTWQDNSSERKHLLFNTLLMILLQLLKL